MPLRDSTRKAIRSSHVRQLANLKVDYTRTPGDEDKAPQDVIEWIRANAKAVQGAQASQITSPSQETPSWDSVFFSLAESAGIYLRKEALVIKAIEAARKGDFDLAENFLSDAEDYVDNVATALGCTFIQLCDFAQRGPDGSWYHSGAYCGVFISNDTKKPYLGVTFKGTDNGREIVTDLDWTPVQGLVPGVAFGALIHKGFNMGLFGTFTTEGQAQIPFDLMVSQLSTVYDERTNGLLHFTGHSLGGAYCHLTYGEFLRRQQETAFKKYQFGDMYSFAAPRVCLQPFASKFAQLIKGNKHAFRFVNADDPVPTAPPRTAGQFVSYPFVQVDGGWHLQPKGPKKMLTEQAPLGSPVPPQSIPSSLSNAKDHRAFDYYTNWKVTPHS